MDQTAIVSTREVFKHTLCCIGSEIITTCEVLGKV